MKAIPDSPTDNIYKFMAISGLWFAAGFIALYVWLVSTQLQLDKEGLKSQAYFFSVNMERTIKARIASLDAGKTDEHRLDWVPASYTLEQEKSFISEALKNHEETIKKNKDVLESRTSEKLQLFSRWDVRIAGFVYVFLMVSLTWFGFSRWVTRTHFVDEELRNLDREIKSKTLEKINLEIAQIRTTVNTMPRRVRRYR